MPIFEYTCAACNKDFEVLVHKKSEISCTYCGSNEVSKKISSFAFSIPTQSPGCASSCHDGFNKGSCGSGMCPGHH